MKNLHMPNGERKITWYATKPVTTPCSIFKGIVRYNHSELSQLISVKLWILIVCMPSKAASNLK